MKNDKHAMIVVAQSVLFVGMLILLVLRILNDRSIVSLPNWLNDHFDWLVVIYMFTTAFLAYNDHKKTDK